MKPNDQAIHVLNDLVRINKDRIEGYQRAIKDSPDADQDLKSLFERMADESRSYESQLTQEVRKLGGEPAGDTTQSGKVYRIWMDIRSSLSKDDNKTALELCEFGEDAAQRAYEKALDEQDLPGDIRQLIIKQKAALKESHDKIKLERDSHKDPSNKRDR